jgi:hypothetical protein
MNIFSEILFYYFECILNKQKITIKVNYLILKQNFN